MQIVQLLITLQGFLRETVNRHIYEFSFFGGWFIIYFAESADNWLRGFCSTRVEMSESVPSAAHFPFPQAHKMH